MANENVLAPSPTRLHDQITSLCCRWVAYCEKVNIVLRSSKVAKEHYLRSLWIFTKQKFFKSIHCLSFCSTASSLHMFWRYIMFEAKNRALPFFSCDERWLYVDANLLKGSLGYPGEIHFVSRMAVNNLYKPLRAILSMINQCLTGKTYGFNRPRYLVLQMLWGIITSTNVDYAKLMWEEFIQPIQTFLADKANLSIAPQKGKKIKPHVIPYYRFTKLIICHLGRTHNIHQRSASPFHLAKEDHKLGNLKFVPKVAKHDQKIVAEKGGQKKPATAKQPKPVPSKQSKPTPATKLKVTQEKPLEPSHAKHPKRGKVQKFHKGKSSLKLIDKDEEVHHEPEPQGDEVDYDVERAIQMSKGKVIATDEQRRTPATVEASTRPFAQPQDDASTNIVRDSPSPADAETEEKTVEINEGQARSDSGKTLESRPPLERVLIEEDQAGTDPGLSHVALVGPDPEPMHDDFVATVYPQVHESLKHPDE
ncbi:hypothetical protein Tco_1129342, partial [Tanacetum coccineum]